MDSTPASDTSRHEPTHPATPARGALARIAARALGKALMAVGAAVAAFLLRMAMEVYLGRELPPFVVCYPTVMLVALLAGLWPGVVATLTSALLTAYWVFLPKGFAIGHPADAVALAIFIFAGTFMSVVAELYRRNRRKAEEQQFYARSLIEASLDPLVTISREGKITDVNQATESVTGAAREQLIGSDFSDYFTEPEKARAGYQQVFADGLVQDYPLAIRHTSGRLTEVLYNATVFRSRKGKVEGVFAAARDITKQKQAEAEAHRYMQELERSNAELQDFASIASHDLQEPLRKVLAFGEHLRERSGDKLDEVGRDFLARMQNAAQRMSGLIGDLLQYSRVATRAQPLEPVDMLAVVFGVVADMEERIAKAHARIEFVPVPKVMADATQVRQLLQNLVANALKFQRPGTRPHVEIEGTVNGQGWCEISVRDNGIGFDEKYLDRIFRPFQRLHGRSEYEGSGMGLAICRKVVEQHGGAITARSRPGEGSTFVVTLPAAERSS